MKALLLGISFIALFGAKAFAASNLVKLTSDQQSDILNYMDGLGKTYGNMEALLNSDGDQEEPARFTYGGHKEDLMDLMTDLYVAGYVTQSQLNKFKALIDQKANQQLCDPNPLTNMNGQQCGGALKAFWLGFYNSEIKYKEPSCKQEDKLTSAGACCEGVYKLPELEPLGSLPGKKRGESCQAHSECKSQVCEKDDEGGGKCGQVYRCFKLIEENKECSPKRPYCAPSCDPSDPNCASGIECMLYDYNSSGVGECKSEGLSCGGDNECCSDKCSGGKCVKKMVCSQCVKQGLPKGNGDCCPGLRESMGGTCIQDFPPFTLPGNVKVEKKGPGIFEKLISILLPSAHAYVMPNDPDGGGGGGGGTTGTNGNSGDSGGECQVGADQLNDAQRAQVEKCITGSGIVGSDSADDIENKTSACAEMKQEFIKANEASGCVETAMSRRDYRDLYNMPEILSKTFSDVKKCEFNSHNDAWRGRSYLARNAELALRGFEVVYSGKGGDMIVSGEELENGKQQYFGKSIFERAQSIAGKYRRNRRELVEQFRELDLEMTCKCLAVFGPNNFDSNKQAYFSQNCSAESGYVTEEGIRENRNDQQATEGEVNGYTELDKGAVGISHEKLMVEWLGLRREMQLRHFANNEELEEEMKDLSEFVTNYNWSETPETEMKDHVVQDFHLIYPASGFFRIILGAILSVFDFIIDLFGTLLGFEGTFGGHNTADFSLAAPSAAESAKIAKESTIAGMYTGASHDPVIEDRQTADDKCWNWTCLREYDKYKRVLKYPYFDNKKISSTLSDSSNHCEVNGSASNCVKSAYLVSQLYTDGQTRTQMYKTQPLLDVTLPITVNQNAYRFENIKDGTTYAKALNYSFTQDALATVKERSKSWFKYKSGKGFYQKKRRYNDNVRMEVLQNQAVLSRFAIDNGTWSPGFFNEKKEAFINGVKEYALCKNLNECAKHSKTLLGPNEDERNKAIGFGFLFEDESDAKLFAEYVYQMHLIWPRIGANGRFGYPTLGMDAYFQTMYYNLMLAGSLALKQTIETQQMYDLYLSDWEKRKGDYQGLGGAEQGTVSSNVEIDEGVFKELKTLEFRNAASVNAYKSKINDYEKNGKFGEAGISALRAVANHALRRIEQDEKRAHYDKTAGATVRGKQKDKAAASFLENFNSPLKSMPLKVGGKDLGSQSLSAPAPATAKNAAPKKVKEARPEPTVASNYKPSFSNYAPAAPSKSYDYGDSGAGLNQDLTNEEAQVMISAASGDKTLEERYDNDSLWNVVSKAYKRNLAKVLVLKSDIRRAQIEEEEPSKEVEISDKDKEELQKLLENN